MATMNQHTPGPWINTFFCKRDGAPIETVEDVAETIAGSARYSERAELFGVSLDDAAQNPDGRSTVVCYTGNGPNAHNNARLMAAAPELLKAAHAAYHALKSYQYGNKAPTLAEECTDVLSAAIAKAEGRA